MENPALNSDIDREFKETANEFDACPILTCNAVAAVIWSPFAVSLNSRPIPHFLSGGVIRVSLRFQCSQLCLDFGVGGHLALFLLAAEMGDEIGQRRFDFPAGRVGHPLEEHDPL